MSSNQYTIRRAIVEDLPHLSRIDNAARQLFLTTPYAYIVAGQTQLNDFEVYYGKDLIWVAVDTEQQPVGFALVFLVDGLVHLHELAVEPAHGRRGIGTQLLRTVLEWARRTGYPSVTLSTFRDVAWNAPFYRRMGFRNLSEAELNPWLRDWRQAEVEYGLPIDQRVCMRLDL